MRRNHLSTRRGVERTGVRIEAIEDVQAHLRHAQHAWAPDGGDAGGVEVGRRTHISQHHAGHGAGGDLARAIPGAGLSGAAHGAVAGEAELAAAAMAGPLEHHGADGFREGRVLHAIQHDLRDGPLAAHGLAAGLVVDRLGEAVEVA